MHYFDNSKLKRHFSLHKVGNKLNEEPLLLSSDAILASETLSTTLKNLFLNSFKTEEYWTFHHDINLSMNEVKVCVDKVFENPEELHLQSQNIAKHLYNQSIHPKIKSGELFVFYIHNCIIDSKEVDAIGLFKSENKETFLEVIEIANGFSVQSLEGTNPNKLDKGCLIFNTEQENGYLISIVDNTNKGSEAQYWKDDFLGVAPKKNEYHQTNQFLGIAKNFVTKQLDEEFEVSKADKIDLLNRSVEYFKTHDTFEKQDFEEEVFQDSNLINAFRNYDNIYRQENEIELSDHFEISPQAVKKQARLFKSVLKLDKNFHIYIHGNKEMIEKGVEKDGRKFYKIYYVNED